MHPNKHGGPVVQNVLHVQKAVGLSPARVRVLSCVNGLDALLQPSCLTTPRCNTESCFRGNHWLRVRAHQMQTQLRQKQF